MYVSNALFASIRLSVSLSHHIYQEGALSPRAVSVQSAGQYTCHASNSEGNVTRVTKVKIKGQLLPDDLSVCLPVLSVSVISVPDWLGATIIYISISPSCIIWQSANRNSKWIQLTLSLCRWYWYHDMRQDVFWDFEAMFYRDKALCLLRFCCATVFWALVMLCLLL